MNQLLDKIRSGQKVIGVTISAWDFPDTPLVLKACGMDFFMIDSEHGDVDFVRACAMTSIARAEGITILARVPSTDRGHILKYVEIGVDGIVLPNCGCREDAQALVRHAKYAPLGSRGVALIKAHSRYNNEMDPVKHMKESNERTTLVVLIETRQGVENIEEIMSVDGIDIAFIGPNDLSQDLGVMGQYGHPDFMAAARKVKDACDKHGKYWGINAANNIEKLSEWHDMGAALNFWGSELSIFLAAAKAGVRRYKEV